MLSRHTLAIDIFSFVQLIKFHNVAFDQILNIVSDSLIPRVSFKGMYILIYTTSHVAIPCHANHRRLLAPRMSSRRTNAATYTRPARDR